MNFLRLPADFPYIVFDVDGTLLDTESIILRGLQHTVRVIQHRDMAIAELRFCLGITAQAGLERLGIPFEEGSALWGAYTRSKKDEIIVFPGIRETLHALKQAGKSLGIVTSRTREKYESEMNFIGLAPFFDVVICKEDSVRHKPSGAPLLAYCQRAGTSSESVLYVGDSVYDMQCARDAGSSGALALWGAPDPAVDAVYRLHAPHELLK